MEREDLDLSAVQLSNKVYSAEDEMINAKNKAVHALEEFMDENNIRLVFPGNEFLIRLVDGTMANVMGIGLDNNGEAYIEGESFNTDFTYLDSAMAIGLCNSISEYIDNILRDGSVEELADTFIELD